MTVTTTHQFGELQRQLTAADDRDAFIAENGDWLAREVEALLERTGGGSHRILSLDVFDTLLLRDDTSELTRFAEIGARMAREVAAEGKATPEADGLVARYLGTRASYRAGPRVNGCGEGALDEIHLVASRLLSGHDGYVDRFIDIEIEREAASVRVHPVLSAVLARHRERGGRVVLLSDMYMRASHIERLLATSGVARDAYDLLVSSADTKVSKASGLVFELVEREMEASPDDFLHVGDALRGDFQRAIARGWRAVHLPIPDKSIAARREDHFRTLESLRERHGIELGIAAPS